MPYPGHGLARGTVQCPRYTLTGAASKASLPSRPLYCAVPAVGPRSAARAHVAELQTQTSSSGALAKVVKRGGADVPSFADNKVRTRSAPLTACSHALFDFELLSSGGHANILCAPSGAPCGPHMPTHVPPAYCGVAFQSHLHRICQFCRVSLVSTMHGRVRSAWHRHRWDSMCTRTPALFSTVHHYCSALS